MDPVANTNPNPNPAPNPPPTPSPDPAPEPAIHPAEFRRLKKEREDLAKQLAEIQNKAKAEEDAKLSELDRVKKERDALAGLKSEHEATVKLLEADIAERLAAFTDAERDEITGLIDGLPFDRRVALVRKFAAERNKTVAPRSADVVRTGPSAGKRLPTMAEIEANPSLIDSLTAAEMQEIRNQSVGGVRGRVFGR